ncbi:hypothetical protein ACROYT_G018917 [Oculina patagonica]
MAVNNSSVDPSLTADEFQDHRFKNETCLLTIDFVAIMISYASIYSFLMAASLVGNSLLIYASVKSKNTRNLVIANIAASDLLFSIVHLPREILVQIKGSATFLVHGWIGSLLCKICAFVADVSIAVSTLSLVLITVDRFVAAVFPTKFTGISVQTRRYYIISTWILAMAIHSPYFYTFRLDERNGESFCISNWEPAFNHETTHVRYYTALLVTVLIVPLVMVSVLQTVILVKLRVDKMAPFRTSDANQRIKKRNKKLLNMSIAISLAFALCWLPFIAFQFFYLYFPSLIPRCSLSFQIFGHFVILLSLCHCIANPCICFTFMRRIRIILRSLRSAYRVHKESRTQLRSRACQETRL